MVTRTPEGGSLAPQVLIVDRQDETLEVLREALERRGVACLSARRAGLGLRLAERHRPAVIVVDDETCDGDPREVFASTNARLLRLGEPAEGPRDDSDESTAVAKPYHYGPLVRKIEALLGRAVS